VTTWTRSPDRLDEAVAARDKDYLGLDPPAAAWSTWGNGEAQAVDLGFCTEPPDGIEPSTYALRVSPGALVRRSVALFDVVSASALVRCRSPVWLLAWLLGTGRGRRAHGPG
jgi:hypothetical protein